MQQVNFSVNSEHVDIMKFIAGLEPDKYKSFHDVIRSACSEKVEEYRSLYVKTLEERYKNEVQSQK